MRERKKEGAGRESERQVGWLVGWNGGQVGRCVWVGWWVIGGEQMESERTKCCGRRLSGMQEKNWPNVILQLCRYCQAPERERERERGRERERKTDR